MCSLGMFPKQEHAASLGISVTEESGILALGRNNWREAVTVEAVLPWRRGGTEKLLSLHLQVSLPGRQTRGHHCPATLPEPCTPSWPRGAGGAGGGWRQAGQTEQRRLRELWPASSPAPSPLTQVEEISLGFPGGSNGKESACNAGDLGLIPGLGTFPWRRECQPTPVFLPGEFHRH